MLTGSAETMKKHLFYVNPKVANSEDEYKEIMSGGQNPLWSKTSATQLGMQVGEFIRLTSAFATTIGNLERHLGWSIRRATRHVLGVGSHLVTVSCF